MRTKTFYVIAGLFVSAAVNILYNLIAAAIQKRALNDQFNDQSIWWLVGLAIAGMIVGYWISNLMSSQTNQASTQSHQGDQYRGANSNDSNKSAKYNVQAENIGAVGENNTVTMTINDSSSK